MNEVTDSNHEAGPGWQKRFFTIWSGQAFSLLGSSLVQFALVWWLTQTTGSAVVLATATLAAMLPEVLLGPFAGALVDRWNRQKVMILADSAIAAATLGLVVLFWTGAVQVWHIYVIMMLRSLGGSFQWPAMQASTSLMVPDKQLSRVAGLNQALRGIVGVLAPPLGALLLGLLPMAALLSIDIVTAALAITPLLLVKIPQPERKAATGEVTPAAVLRDVRAGLRYVMAWPGLLGILVIALVINFLLSPASTLVPLLITRHFNGGAWHLGALEAASGIGSIAGGVLLSIWGGFKRRIFTLLIGVIGIGIGMMMMGLAPASLFGMAIAGAAVAGALNPLANGPLMAIVQARVAPEMQGRVFTLINSLAGAAMPLSMLVAAPVADALGIQSWFILGSMGCVVLGLAGFMIRPIAHVDDESGAPAAVPVVAPAVEKFDPAPVVE